MKFRGHEVEIMKSVSRGMGMWRRIRWFGMAEQGLGRMVAWENGIQRSEMLIELVCEEAF
jgi:hypothetical protein